MKNFIKLIVVLVVVGLMACSNGTTTPSANLIIDGVIWADTNLNEYQTFADRPDMYTNFYQWNRSTSWPAGGPSPLSGWDSTDITDPAWTVNPCPPGWRLPTETELDALYESGSSWAPAGTRGNAVAGDFFGPNHYTASLPDNMDGAIFLPASGYVNLYYGTITAQGTQAFYWSSTNYDSADGWEIGVGSGSMPPGNGGKTYGYNIRPVRNAK